MTGAQARSLLFLFFCSMTATGLWLMWPAFAIFACGLVGASITLLIHYNEARPAVEEKPHDAA